MCNSPFIPARISRCTEKSFTCITRTAAHKWAKLHLLHATANPTFNHSSLRSLLLNAKAYNKKFLKPYSKLLRFQELFICDLFGRERINQN